MPLTVVNPRSGRFAPRRRIRQQSPDVGTMLAQAILGRFNQSDQFDLLDLQNENAMAMMEKNNQFLAQQTSQTGQLTRDLASGSEANALALLQKGNEFATELSQTEYNRDEANREERIAFQKAQTAAVTSNTGYLARAEERADKTEDEERFRREVRNQLDRSGVNQASAVAGSQESLQQREVAGGVANFQGGDAVARVEGLLPRSFLGGSFLTGASDRGLSAAESQLGRFTEVLSGDGNPQVKASAISGLRSLSDALSPYSSQTDFLENGIFGAGSGGRANALMDYIANTLGSDATRGIQTSSLTDTSEAAARRAAAPFMADRQRILGAADQVLGVNPAILPQQRVNPNPANAEIHSPLVPPAPPAIPLGPMGPVDDPIGRLQEEFGIPLDMRVPAFQGGSPQAALPLELGQMLARRRLIEEGILPGGFA